MAWSVDHLSYPKVTRAPSVPVYTPCGMPVIRLRRSLMDWPRFSLLSAARSFHVNESLTPVVPDKSEGTPW